MCAVYFCEWLILFLLDIFDVFTVNFLFVSLLSIMVLVNILCTWVDPISEGMAAFIFLGLTFFLKILVIFPVLV